jgi:hypothetical protein
MLCRTYRAAQYRYLHNSGMQYNAGRYEGI